MCGQSLVSFGLSVIYIIGVHYNRQKYYLWRGAIISFKFRVRRPDRFELSIVAMQTRLRVGAMGPLL